jgi:hypothetical protein
MVKEGIVKDTMCLVGACFVSLVKILSCKLRKIFMKVRTKRNAQFIIPEIFLIITLCTDN